MTSIEYGPSDKKGDDSNCTFGIVPEGTADPSDISVEDAQVLYGKGYSVEKDADFKVIFIAPDD